MPQQVGEFGFSRLVVCQLPRHKRVLCAFPTLAVGHGGTGTCAVLRIQCVFNERLIVFPFVNGNPPCKRRGECPTIQLPIGNNPWMRERAFSAPVTAVSNLNPCSGVSFVTVVSSALVRCATTRCVTLFKSALHRIASCMPPQTHSPSQYVAHRWRWVFLQST